MLTFLSSRLSGLKVFTIALLYCSTKVLSGRHGRLITAILLLSSSLFGHSLTIYDLIIHQEGRILAEILFERSTIVGVHVLSVYIYLWFRRYLRSDIYASDAIMSTLPERFSFGLIWCGGCAALHLLHTGQYGGISNNSSLYPFWLAGRGADRFLDAVLAQGFGEVIEILLTPRTTRAKETMKEYSEYQSVHAPRPIGHIASSLGRVMGIVVMMLGLAGCVNFITKHSPASSIRIGCTNPVGLISNDTIIEKLREEMAYVDVLVIPATANYITDVNTFVKFKEYIDKMIEDQLVSVVIPTQDFRREAACKGRHNLQIYNLGEDEETTATSYVHSLIPADNGVSHDRLKLGSLFRTWVSLRVQERFGRLMTASAICIESDFAKAFKNTAGPDLLIIPASSWSMDSPSDKLKSMTEFAIKKSTNILYCDQDESGYIDAKGTVIRHIGRDSFSIDYDLVDRGLHGYRMGLWWMLIPVCTVLCRWIQVCSSSSDTEQVDRKSAGMLKVQMLHT